MGKHYNNLGAVELIIMNSASLSSCYISSRNEMLNNMFDIIMNVMYTNNHQDFYTELYSYIKEYPLNLGCITSTNFIEQKYIDIINHFIRKYFRESLKGETFVENSVFNKFSDDEINSLITIKFQTEYNDNYYKQSENISFKIYLDSPKLLKLLNSRSSSNIEIDEHGVIKTKLHGLISEYIMSTSEYEINDINEVLIMYKEVFNNCYKVINKIKNKFNIE